MHNLAMVSAAVCHPGCQCKEGYVLNQERNVCVRPQECPCHHGGRSYGENTIVQSDCNTWYELSVIIIKVGKNKFIVTARVKVVNGPALKDNVRLNAVHGVIPIIKPSTVNTMITKVNAIMS